MRYLTLTAIFIATSLSACTSSLDPTGTWTITLTPQENIDPSCPLTILPDSRQLIIDVQEGTDGYLYVATVDDDQLIVVPQMTTMECSAETCLLNIVVGSTDTGPEAFYLTYILRNSTDGLQIAAEGSFILTNYDGSVRCEWPLTGLGTQE